MWGCVVLLVDAVPWFGSSGARSFIPAHAQALPSRTVPVKHARFARPRGLVLDGGEHGGMIGLAGRGCRALLRHDRVPALERHGRQIAERRVPAPWIVEPF